MGRGAQKKNSGSKADKNDNGLVGPGRKSVHKAKSNGTLSGAATGAQTTTNASTNTNSYPHANGRTVSGNQKGGQQDLKLQGPASATRRGSLGQYPESSSTDSYTPTAASNMLAIPAAASASASTHRQIDVNLAKNPAVHRDTSALSFMITVLKSCPLYDTIAILIVLLQIPPAFLTVVHLLFATMTFVPPSTAGSSFGFADIFEGTLGTPSVATLVAVDALVLMVWLFLWSPLQDLSLDLAQTVIALTLGGGTQGKGSGFQNAMFCLGIVGASHYVKNSRGVRASRFGWLFSGSEGEGREKGEIGGFVWVRTIVAVHILTQGIVRYIRDWYLKRERKDKGRAVTDPEAGAAVAVDGSSVPSTAVTTPEGEADKSPPNPKKKKKASALIRIRQPLWSAIASTKIVMAKEYETSRQAAESGLGLGLSDANNLGSAPFGNEADRIWITYVGFDEVRLSTSYFSPPDSIPATDSSTDVSKPFYVRVNKTVWQPTRITPIDDPDNNTEVRYYGEVFGLAPFSNYDIEFVSTISGEPLFSTSVRTMAAPVDPTKAASSLAASSIIATNLTNTIPRSSRPDSPTTTLRNSILTAEAKLAEEKNRQKRERKEIKSKLHTLRKEIERLGAGVANMGGNDDKLRMKVVQSNLHAKQADDAVEAMISELEELEEKSAVEVSRQWKMEKAVWSEEKETHKSSRTKFHEAKTSASDSIAALTSELQALQQKRERMQSRIARLNGELERISDANARGLDEAQRKEKGRAAKDADHARTEMLYLERLDQLTQSSAQISQSLTTIWASIAGLQQREMEVQAAVQAQSMQYANAVAQQNLVATGQPSPVGTTSEGVYPWVNAGAAYGAGYANLYPTPAVPAPRRRQRGRSNSMLSGVSGFTLSDDEDASARPKTAVAGGTENRKVTPGLGGDRSEGSGSNPASRQNTGSAGNGSPITGMAEAVNGVNGKTMGFRLRPPPGLGGVAVWRNPWDP